MRRSIAEIRKDVERSMREVWEKQDEIVDLHAKIRGLTVQVDELAGWSKLKAQTLTHLRSQQMAFQTELEAAIAEGAE